MKHLMQIMGRDGHKTMEWGIQDKTSVKTAEATFNELLGKGYRAFRDGDGAKDGPMKTFDSTATEIVMTVPLVGG